MSIYLDIKDYCAECPEFEAGVVKNCLKDAFGENTMCDTRVYCKNNNKCIDIMDHLKNTITPNRKLGEWSASFNPKTYTTTVTCSACGQESTYVGDALTVLETKCGDECPDCKAKMVRRK